MTYPPGGMGLACRDISSALILLAESIKHVTKSAGYRGSLGLDELAELGYGRHSICRSLCEDGLAARALGFGSRMTDVLDGSMRGGQRNQSLRKRR